MTTSREAATYPFPARCPFQPHEEFAWRRANAPVAPVTLARGGEGWLVTRFADVRTVLADERFSRRPVRDAAVGRQRGPAPAFDFGASIAEPEQHARWRRLTAQVFNVRQAEAMRPRVAAIVDDLLDDLAAADHPDLMDALAFPLPLRVLLALFDVPDDLRGGFLEWATALRASGASMTAFAEAMNALHASVRELVARGRGIVGDLLAAKHDDGEPCSPELAVSTMMLMTVAGYETVATQLGNGFLALFQHPGQWDRLRAGEVGVEPAVEEILRYAQAGTGFAGLTYPTSDVTIGDTTIPAGDAVFISIDSAGRDADQVSDPDRFDLARGAARHHLSFGFGAHFCMGAPLARVELQEALGRTVRRFPGLRPAFAVDAPEMTANRFTRYPRTLPVGW
ncbi:cytochrome P450 [Actinokineospora fastidiosa]|uniref:Cytochrome P450 n=1 Tax=Actinokineospora fastidiosa TaxID=1816 RepID=A0A918GMY3_9PSEU|nr:cytochrome P450 [Actinokineospora fastidiosa]GGS46136.1 cytochrome P450 [Actinokineospora fastidiosa]